MCVHLFENAHLKVNHKETNLKNDSVKWIVADTQIEYDIRSLNFNTF